MEMLEITRSKIRKEILNLYFTNQDRKFYLRELEKILNFPVANIRRELVKLEKVGLFRSEKKGNLKFYFLNTSYPLFQEIKSIISKTSGVPFLIKNALKNIKNIEMAFIYGSFAKGEEKNTSDIDLFIIGNPDETELIRNLNSIEKKLQREINYAIYSRKSFQKKKEEKDSFILEVIKSPKIILIGNENEL